MDWTAIAHFSDRAAADAAFAELIEQGYAQHQLSLLGPGAEDHDGLHDDHVTTREGVTVGGVAGALLGIGAMLIPGIGPIVAAGPLAAALGGAIAGGVAGSAVGGVAAALVDSGVEHDTAHYYDARLKQGGILMLVHTDEGGYDKARAILQRHGGDIEGAGEFALPPAETGPQIDDPSIGLHRRPDIFPPR
jgi:hypothetical protein